VKRLLIANRGEIAVRIARTARTMGIETVAVYSDAEPDAPHVRCATYAVRLGPAPPSESYANVDAMLAAALASGADAVHPGYGFLAENPAFAERCVAAGLTFVGPSAEAMRALGHKASAKRLLAGADVPFLPGYHEADQSDAVLLDAATRIGYPLMIKASAGGGGRGMRLVTDGSHFAESLRAARSEALAAFGDGDVLLERAIMRPRHIEVQIFADVSGNVVHLGERDCSVQRRHQKLIEEAPSPFVDAELRERLGAAAIRVARAAAYVGAGTVEFLVDEDGAFAFIEMNTRLQVEHPVTEETWGVDLVAWQLRVACGEALPVTELRREPSGHAIEARLCAEDPDRAFLPQTGTLVAWAAPSGVRVEHALEPGIAISPYYDSMIAKLIAHGPTREDARRTLVRALDELVVLGVATNRDALVAFLDDARFVAGDVTTRFIEESAPTASRTEPQELPRAVAAALLYALAVRQGRFGLWETWSSSQLPASTIALSFGDGAAQSYVIAAVAPHDVTVTVDATPIRVELAQLASDDSQVRYRLDGGAWRACTFARDHATLFLRCDGATYVVTDRSAELAAAARAGAAGDGFLRAPMTGRVVGVFATAGEVAKAGATLVVLEAMKMEHVLSLATDARVRDVTAISGLQVSANDVLLEYEITDRV
jgi:geranyl-CoA carboxylase alpha subunit